MREFTLMMEGYVRRLQNQAAFWTGKKSQERRLEHQREPVASLGEYEMLKERLR